MFSFLILHVVPRIISDTVGRYLKLPIKAEIGCMPITTTSEGQDIVCLNHSHNIIITLQPVIAGSVNPSNIMTTVSWSTLVGDNTDQLIVTRVEARIKWSVQQIKANDEFNGETWGIKLPITYSTLFILTQWRASRLLKISNLIILFNTVNIYICLSWISTAGFFL